MINRKTISINKKEASLSNNPSPTAPQYRLSQLAFPTPWNRSQNHPKSSKLAFYYYHWMIKTAAKQKYFIRSMASQQQKRKLSTVEKHADIALHFINYEGIKVSRMKMYQSCQILLPECPAKARRRLGAEKDDLLRVHRFSV
jgi:hypothetical protein